MERKYYWLKLQTDFFNSKRIKKLRRLAGGDTYVIIYLKMQLLSLKSDGVLTFTGLEADFAEELALDIDEEPENVKVTLQYLLSCGLAETSDNVNFFLPYSIANTGKETAAAERVRKMRERKNVTMLQACYADDEKRNVEIEIEKEIEIDKEKIKRKTPTLEEIKAYVAERKSNVDPVKFFEYYSAGGWKDAQGRPVKNWKQKLITWERHESKSKNAPISGDPVKADDVKRFLNGL